MKCRTLGYVFIFLTFCWTSCQKSGVDELRRDLNAQAERLAALEAWQEEVNHNITVLQALVDALRYSKYITAVTETAVGYSITLSDGSILHIWHGVKGDTGATGGVVMPSITVRDSSDGHTYWLVNGTLLADSQGNAVRADGEKGDPGIQGEAGIPGTTPQLRIHPETNEWEVSLDEGASWHSMGIKATGPAGEQGNTGGEGPVGPSGPEGPVGDAIFAKDGVQVFEEYVEFTLADAAGTKIKVPRYQGLGLHFPRGTEFRMPRCVVKTIPFTVTGSGKGIQVSVLGNGAWQADVRMDAVREDSGVIVVQVPEEAGGATLPVLLTDGKGGCWSYRLNVRAQPTPRMIRVPGGDLGIIGSHGQGWRISEYWISETEVTNRQYCDFLNSLDPIPTPEDINNIPRDSTWFWPYMGFQSVDYEEGVWIPLSKYVIEENGIAIRLLSDFPLRMIWWFGAMAYCDWAGGCLPTEAQWEYAARGSDRNPNAATEIYSGGNDLDEVAWWEDNRTSIGAETWVRIGYTHYVATRKANFLGIHDMTGNVEEWCADWWGENYPERGLTVGMDPQGPLEGTYRVVRGGAYSYCMHEVHWGEADWVNHWNVSGRCWLLPFLDGSNAIDCGIRLAYVDR